MSAGQAGQGWTSIVGMGGFPMAEEDHCQPEWQQPSSSLMPAPSQAYLEQQLEYTTRINPFNHWQTYNNRDSIEVAANLDMMPVMSLDLNNPSGWDRDW